MKKYEKPQLKIEVYELSESIASGCGADDGWVVRGNQDLSNCFVETDSLGIDNLRFFAENTATCDNKDYESGCYMVLSGAAGIQMNS